MAPAPANVRAAEKSILDFIVASEVAEVLISLTAFSREMASDAGVHVGEGDALQARWSEPKRLKKSITPYRLVDLRRQQCGSKLTRLAIANDNLQS
jgi:hypothetical protein